MTTLGGSCLCGDVRFEVDGPFPKLYQCHCSTGFRSWFCKRRGSTVPNPLRDTSYAWVPAGALDDDGPLEIAAQLFLAPRTSWDRPRSDGIQHDTAPTLAEFIAILHGEQARSH
jgi:hypothetical protein